MQGRLGCFVPAAEMILSANRRGTRLPGRARRRRDNGRRRRRICAPLQAVACLVRGRVPSSAAPASSRGPGDGGGRAPWDPGLGSVVVSMLSMTAPPPLVDMAVCGERVPGRATPRRGLRDPHGKGGAGALRSSRGPWRPSGSYSARRLVPGTSERTGACAPAIRAVAKLNWMALRSTQAILFCRSA